MTETYCPPAGSLTTAKARPGYGQGSGTQSGSPLKWQRPNNQNHSKLSDYQQGAELGLECKDSLMGGRHPRRYLFTATLMPAPRELLKSRLFGIAYKPGVQLLKTHIALEIFSYSYGFI